MILDILVKALKPEPKSRPRINRKVAQWLRKHRRDDGIDRAAAADWQRVRERDRHPPTMAGPARSRP